MYSECPAAHSNYRGSGWPVDVASPGFLHHSIYDIQDTCVDISD
jgi:hypothetical protein